ncbi:flavin-containing monooxygenase [Smaragdicoccus niigatensis]|uniref:flavin-containing monooxygenase n=1 Tax=Smaragdicoccus niigatensis TaxID=359359 RepID=UPI0003688987|nr:NAD(P)/FAD-dependent oxidoreductase [Smaragdicoccus niigatensis]
MTKHFDVLIVGAGVAGVGMASHLTKECPDLSYAVLERRANVGGTWDLFKYPGIRSDSDMYTFGYGFRPWGGTKVLSDGPGIRQYVEDTAKEYGVFENIRFGRKVLTAKWSTPDTRWTVEALDESTGETETYTATFIVGCTGYYNYDQGYSPEFPGAADFKGQIVHPQHWPEDLDYAGKKVVIIGSGATAITLVPNMADDAEHVTMLQRSPTYIMAVPANDPLSSVLSRTPVPQFLVRRASRLSYITIQRALYDFCRTQPRIAKKLLLTDIRRRVGKNVDMRHFTPSYNPWDQRLCVVPNGDLFKVLKNGKASIETDHIKSFTETGIELKSGKHLEADIIITATGLNVQVLGGVQVEVDGMAVSTHDRVLYKSVMVEGVPNAAIVLGYTNASWTLKTDLAAEWVCRVLNLMRRKGYSQAVAHAKDGDRAEYSLMGGALSSGYIQRGDWAMPRQGTRAPWKAQDNYLLDIPLLRHQSLKDDVLEFSR